MSKTIVVIGGAGGGPVAAARAREFDETARIVLVEKKPHVSWVQAGLRHHLEGRVIRLDELDRDRASFFADRHRIEVRTGVEAIRLDPDSHRIVLKNVETQQQETLRYDAAIFSGGASVVLPKLPGLEGEGVIAGFRTLDDLQAVQRALAAGAKRAVVIGCGPFGLDAAVALRGAGMDVSVVEKNDRILPALSLLAARAAGHELKALGVTLHLGDEVVSVAAQGKTGRTLTLRSGRVLDADLVVVTAGLRPRTGLLSDAGASLNSDGSVRVNAHMQTTLPGVFACGTAVSVTHAVTRTPLWLPQAAIASRTAQIAGRSAAVGDGPKESLSPMAGTALYIVGKKRFARTGLSETDARAVFGADRIFVTTIHGYAAEPWIGGDELCVRLVVDRQQNVVVGGEVWGREGVPRRIDLIAAAVLDGWSPQRLSDLDMAYTPALGPAFDAVCAAGQAANLTMSGDARPIGAEALALRLVQNSGTVLVDVGRDDRPDAWPKGTLHIPLEKLRERTAEIPRDRDVILVSHTGQRAYVAFRVLRALGYERALHLDGGFLSYALTLD